MNYWPEKWFATNGNFNAKTSNMANFGKYFSKLPMRYTVVCKKVHKIESVWCKMALGEVGVSLPWWYRALVLLDPGYWRLFLNLKKLFIVEKWPLKMTRGHFSIGQSWNFEFHKVKLLKFQSFNFDLWKNDHYKKKKIKLEKSLQ